ncbi:Cytospin-B [Camelus dromedarius]|uniref:Cytospin-B n=1 Tax=Camelus dromedarius TaxID=9838 RepID=A0A5N4D556_CAMDR|nr:Cytospin-B [Camelus dromedarius]
MPHSRHPCTSGRTAPRQKKSRCRLSQSLSPPPDFPPPLSPLPGCARLGSTPKTWHPSSWLCCQLYDAPTSAHAGRVWAQMGEALGEKRREVATAQPDGVLRNPPLDVLRQCAVVCWERIPGGLGKARSHPSGGQTGVSRKGGGQSWSPVHCEPSRLQNQHETEKEPSLRRGLSAWPLPTRGVVRPQSPSSLHSGPCQDSSSQGTRPTFPSSPRVPGCLEMQLLIGLEPLLHGGFCFCLLALGPPPVCGHVPAPCPFLRGLQPMVHCQAGYCRREAWEGRLGPTARRDLGDLPSPLRPHLPLAVVIASRPQTYPTLSRVQYVSEARPGSCSLSFTDLHGGRATPWTSGHGWGGVVLSSSAWGQLPPEPPSERHGYLGVGGELEEGQQPLWPLCLHPHPSRTFRKCAEREDGAARRRHPRKSAAPTPTKHARAAPARPRQEQEGAEKAVLESQAKEKDSEINRLRSELKSWGERRAQSAGAPAGGRRAGAEALVRALEKNRSSEEALAELQEENRALKEKLAYLEHSPHSEGAASHAGDSSCPTSITQESSCGSPAGIESTGDSDAEQRNTQGGALRTSGSSSSDVTKASLSPDASDFEHIPADAPSGPLSPAGSLFKSPACSAAGGSPNTASELSLASLTEKIHRMEENQHSTAEELQATLQELSDQQQMLQELTAENEKLVDEKALLETSFQQHRERAEQLSQENEKLIALLQERARGEEPGAQEGKILELEQKCTEILEQGRFEREKLLSIQQQLTCSLRKAEEEHRAALEMVKRLKEENGRLSAFLELQRRDGGAMATTLEECRAALEGLKVENGSLKAHLEKEKQSAVETGPPGQTAEGCEVQEMLRVARAEKEQLEQSCSELKQELLKARGEVKHVSSLLAKVRGLLFAHPFPGRDKGRHGRQPRVQCPGGTPRITWIKEGSAVHRGVLPPANQFARPLPLANTWCQVAGSFKCGQVASNLPSPLGSGSVTQGSLGDLLQPHSRISAPSPAAMNSDSEMQGLLPKGHRSTFCPELWKGWVLPTRLAVNLGASGPSPVNNRSVAVEESRTCGPVLRQLCLPGSVLIIQFPGPRAGWLSAWPPGRPLGAEQLWPLSSASVHPIP